MDCRETSILSSIARRSETPLAMKLPGTTTSLPSWMPMADTAMVRSGSTTASGEPVAIRSRELLTLEGRFSVEDHRYRVA